MTRQTGSLIPWICLPQGDLPTVHSRYTHRSSAPSKDPLGPFDAALLLCGALELVAVLWRLRSYCDIIIIIGCLPSLSLTSIGLRCTLEGGRQASYQPSDASTPKQTNIFNHIEAFSFTY